MRETLDFAARFQGVGHKAGMLPSTPARPLTAPTLAVARQEQRFRRTEAAAFWSGAASQGSGGHHGSVAAQQR